MSWIKENKFLATLGGGTLLGLIVLYVVGAQGSSRYATSKTDFDSALSDVTGYEKGPLYPNQANRDAKRKAIGDYRRSVETLQTTFQPFRPEELKNISPQEFADHLVAANAETRAAFTESEVVVPEAYFVGFEKYRGSLAAGSSTGVLDYELGSVKNLMLALAKARPTELKNLHRPDLPEDSPSGQPFNGADVVARPFPLEITFTGTEKSVREYISAITKADKQYVVIRSLRISNMKKEPPKSSDAQFEKPAAAAPAAAASGGFSGDFVLPGDEPAAAPKPAEPAAAAPAAKPAADSGRILSQVLGTEQLQVFLRLDVLQFLPPKKLP